MVNVKTAISIEKPLFDEVEALAEDMKVSRSRVFALAAQQFVEEHKNRKLLEAINATYEPPTEEERAVLEQIRESQRQLVDEW
jgi:metal-responsive CopG/Arc/MetJ family transcriptional regulator